MANNYNMRRLFIALLTALLSVTASQASDYDFEVDGIYYNKTSKTNFEVEVTFFMKNIKGEPNTKDYFDENNSLEAELAKLNNFDGETFSNSIYSGDVVIPSTVTKDGITYSVTSIGYGAFANCDELTSVEIPNSVTIIGEKAFANCVGLTSVEIPNSVTIIGKNAFDLCTGLTSVEIPNSVTSIGSSAFSCCEGLTSVVIGNSVTSIEPFAFCGCDNLTDVYSLNVTPSTCARMVFSSSTYKDATLHVPSSSVEDYKNADVWCEFAHIE